MSHSSAYAKAHGFYVPLVDAARFQAIDVLDGLPNMDVKKVKAASAICKRRRRALDVGANVGITATLLKRTFERVEAFEAVPEIHGALVLNTHKDPDLVAHLIAIGREPGALRFEYKPSHGQLSHALLDGEAPKWDDSFVTDPIEVRTIDSYGYGDVDFIKIDTEGFEGPVVFGAKDTILHCRPVILMEQRGNEALMHGAEVNEASKFVESLGMVEVKGMPFWKDRVYQFPE
ncbi:methyltransferase [Caulobacter phage CcrPW]|uniref:Methyltransferase FkbM domain-containing protein n=1 Tax=Caulobacter phage CcrPW TaxID=2283271 RepID=A0A385E9W2_9CAUD|nr:methyltransferase [Caulobacter phage CcrPW]AXQ68644.1 hypothetical protein CcrPW_gp105c [Caulobacter phage CcrPW]